MKKHLLHALLFLLSINIYGQSTIEGSFMVDNTEKSYALYIPQDYDPTIANPMLLGLHPLNVNRWDAVSWRDTLVQFAESNKLLLVCPDGGPDGRVDDPIDTLFTSMLVDSIAQWYNIDEEEKYIMGFSWGGRTTYTYGLRRTQKYKGLLAIGAAVDLSVIEDVLPMAQDQAIYVLHGNQDAIGVRYTPIVNALEDNGACVETLLLTGVGHTIDFPDRNNLLTEAYNSLRNSNCGLSSTSDTYNDKSEIYITPNPNSGRFLVENLNDTQLSTITIYNSIGQSINYSIRGNSIVIEENKKGIYYLAYIVNTKKKVEKIAVY